MGSTMECSNTRGNSRMGNLHGQQERAKKIIRVFKRDEYNEDKQELSFFKLQRLLCSEGIYMEIGEINDVLYEEVK